MKSNFFRMEYLFYKDSTNSTAITNMARETSAPEMYSIRPCPKGWAESGFCPAILKPTSVITEEAPSDKLLKASAVIAMEPLKKPARNFPANRKN